MPVYLDETDSRKEFIRECIKKNPMVALDTSHFATWIYAGSNGYESATFDAYADLVGTVASEFPNVEYSDVVQEIANVLGQEEEEYFDTWAEYGTKLAREAGRESLREALTLVISDSVGNNKELTIDYDPNVADC